MSKDVWYRQCTYKCGNKQGTSWLPENLAKVGKQIYFGKKTDKPSEMWTIVAVYGREKESYLISCEMDYKNQRKVSDI